METHEQQAQYQALQEACAKTQKHNTNYSKFDLFKPLKTTAAFVKDIFYYKDCATSGDEARAYSLPPSVQKHMRIVEYDRSNEAFLLADGKSFLAAYEIRGFPTEGRDDAALQEYALKMQQLIDTFPRSKLSDSPYVVQCYVSDEPNLFSWYERLKTYADDNAKGSKLNDIYIKMAKEHMSYLCREGGIFTDQLNGNAFKGGERITRLVFYRKCPAKLEHKELREFKRLCKSLETKLDNFKRQGMDYRKYDDKAMFYWLFNTFNKSVDHFDEVSEYLDQFPYEQTIENRPYGYHFMELAFGSGIKAEAKTKTWKIGQTYHKHISCLGLRKVAPKLGAVSAERSVSEGVTEAFLIRCQRALPCI